MRVDDVAKELGVSKSYAYKIVQKLNTELRSMGFDGRQAVKSAFALLSQKVTKARRLRGGKGGID